MVPADAFDESCDEALHCKNDLLTAGTCLLTMRERHDLSTIKKPAEHWTFHTPQHPQLFGQCWIFLDMQIYNDTSIMGPTPKWHQPSSEAEDQVQLHLRCHVR